MFSPHRLSTLLLILLPLLSVVLGLRLFLHRIDHNVDLRIAGYEVHHLFAGTLLVLPAAFVLAFDVRRARLRAAALVVLGVGSGLVLDEVVYLIVTDGSNDAYLTLPSVAGAVVFVGLAAALLLGLYVLTDRRP